MLEPLVVDDERASLVTFPGPLVRGETLKSEVAVFLDAKLQELQERVADAP